MKYAVAIFTLVAALCTQTLHASDPVALYALVDKIVVEPASGPAQAVQVWGVFAIAKPDDRNGYLPPTRGYLYFKLAGNDDLARKEWSDLAQVAGSGQIVALGSRYQLRARVRKADESPRDPDGYVVASGLTRVRRDTTYTPIRSLLEYRR